MKKNNLLKVCTYVSVMALVGCSFRGNAQQMMAMNEPILDSLERVSMDNLVKIQDGTAEFKIRKNVSTSVNAKLFQHLGAFKFQLYVDNKKQKKVVIRLRNNIGTIVFEDVVCRKDKFQRFYDFSFLANTGEYLFSAFYDNQEHYFLPIRLESIESIEELAMLSNQYPPK